MLPGPTWSPIIGPIDWTFILSSPKEDFSLLARSWPSVSQFIWCTTTPFIGDLEFWSNTVSIILFMAFFFVLTFVNTVVFPSSTVRIGFICNNDPNKAAALPILPPFLDILNCQVQK